MDFIAFLKESIPKRDKLKHLIVAHTGLSPPAFVAAVTASAATIAAITCLLKSTPCCAAKDRHIKNEANGTDNTGSEENQTSNCACNCERNKKEPEEAVNNEAIREMGILTPDEEVQARALIAEIMATDYMQADADELATPVETPKEI